MDPLNPGGEHRHLTWRDLPPTPPTGPILLADPAATSAPPAPAVLPPAPRRRGRTALVLGAGALAGLLALGGILAVANPLSASDNNPGSGQSGLGAANPTAPSTSGSGSTAAPSAPSNQSGSEPLADVAAKILPSVVQIETGGGLGSGFVADANGDILTAAHVVSGASQVTVKLQDGTSVAGTVAASDASIDTAVVKVAQAGLPALELGDSEPGARRSAGRRGRQPLRS